MKKTLLICLCFFSVFTCLAYAFPINTRLEENTDRVYFANDCLGRKQQNAGAIDAEKRHKSDDLILAHPDLVISKHDDKHLLAGRIHPSSVKYELTGAITVSISPTQNKAFHIKGDELELIAIVTGEATGAMTYEWYYVKDNGEEEPIEDSLLSTTVDGSCLIIPGLKLTTVKNTVAPIFSIVDHIPSLGEIVFNAIPTVGAGIYAGVSQEMLRNEFRELNKITSYTPKGYTMPIGVRVIMGGISATSSLFTRPVFTRPATPTYRVDSPTSCCQEDVITLTNTSSDVNDPSVIYMWLWYPSNNTPTPFSYPFASADLVRFVNQNELSIPMKKPGCAGNYTLMAFSVPTSCFSVAEPTDVMVYPKPTSRGNTQLKTIGSGTISNTYCEGATIQIEGDKDGLNSDQGLEIGYQWYHDGVLIKNSPDGAYDKEYYSIGNATPDRSGTYTRVATASYANGPKKSHCSVTATISITVNPKLAKPGAITYNLQTCDGDDLVLSTDPVVGASQYRWTFADKGLGGASGIRKEQFTTVPQLVRRSVKTTMAVTYTVTALDANGCESPPSDGTKVELLDKKDEACVKVYINPLQNMAFVCKDSKFALMASTSTVSMTTQEQTDMEAAEKGKTSAEYRWYYVNEDGSLEEIMGNNGTNIIVVGRVLIMNNGPEVTTTLPAEATAFSIADNIPGLGDILNSAATQAGAGANTLESIMESLGRVPGLGSLVTQIQKGISDAGTQKLKEYLPKDLDKYKPTLYTRPIIAKLSATNHSIKNATPFTRPVFERPKDPAYTISPLTCCQGVVVTFSSDDAQLGQPEVMYMWLGYPNLELGLDAVSTAGFGSAFLINPTKMFTKGPIPITMGDPRIYTGNYALSAFRGAPSPIGCSSISKTTKIIVYGVPISERNTRLKTRDGELTYCEGETINIKSKDDTDFTTDGALGKGDMLYKWYDKNNTLIKSDGNYEFEQAGTFGPPRKGENLIIKNATAADAGTYTRHAIFKKTGCKAAATITINISPKPAPPTGLTSNSPICPGDQLVISVPPGAVGVTAYEWAGPKETISGEKTSTLTIKKNASVGTYIVKAKNAQGCLSDAATITVALAENNLASLLTIGSNAPVVEGARLALSATDIPGATYEWKGPNGFSSTSPNCSVSNTATAAMSGTYTLTVTKCNGTYTASKPIQVQVYDKSVLDILNTDLTRTICSGDPINIALSSTLSGVKYRWTALVSNGNASSPTTQDNVFEIKATPINSGLTSGAVTYTVTPIFKDGTKEITGNPKDFVITVLPIKPATINNKSTNGKNMSSFTWKPTSTGTAVTYTWYLGPNKAGKINTGVNANGDYTFDTPTPGIYTHYLTTQTAGDPCESASAKLELKVEHTITLSFNKNPIIDQGESAVLTASLSGVTAPAGGITITLQHTPSSFAILPTIYIPAGSSSGFTTIVTTKSLIMLDDEKISFTGTKAAPYTIILPTDLTIQRDQSLSTITLNFNQASVKGGEHATLTAKLPDGVLATQPIEILLEADDDHSTAEEDENYKDLRASMTIDVGANSKTIEAFTAKNKGVIDGLTHLQLKAKVLDPKGYHIADPKPKISISDTTGDDPANRVITLAFKKPSVIGGDTDELIISLPKGIVSANDISVTLTKDPNTGKGTSRAKRNINYESFPDAIRIRAFRNSATYPLTTIGDEKVSKITTMAISGTALEYEFKSLAKVSIISGLHVPNVFTPGGVGDHPTWMIKGLHLYPNCDVKVFNRYGQIVFKSRGYAEPWNGGYQNNLGKEMPVGTYYYVIQLNSSHKGAKRVLKGHVAIIR